MAIFFAFLAGTLGGWAIASIVVGLDRRDVELDVEGYPVLRALLPVLGVLSGINTRIGLAWGRARLTLLLNAAGRPAEMGPDEFFAFQEILAAVFGIAPLLVGLDDWLWPAGFAIIGFSLPFLWLVDLAEKRRREIRRAMPYTLDLLTLLIEAGMDFLQAIATVVERGRPGPLRSELREVLKEIQLGRTRAEALRNLDERLRMPEVSALVVTITQADEMGSGLGPTLRIHASELRSKRMLLAEKAAGQAPVKMLLPLVGFIFPCIFLIVLGPFVVRLLHEGF